MGIEKPQKREANLPNIDGENLEDYKAALDNQIIEGAKLDITLQKQALDGKHMAIQEDPGVASYFEKESKLPAIEEQIEHLKAQIEEAMNANSPLSKEMLDRMIGQLRLHERGLQIMNVELNARHNNDINVRVALAKMKNLEETISKLDTRLERIISEYKRREADNPGNPTFSLN